MKKTNKIIVTGGSGFIGSHLMKALGEDGVNYDIKASKFADINDSEMLLQVIKMAKPRAIVHLAAISNRKNVDKDPGQALKTNIIGSFNVMRIAYKYGIRVIVASSAATYEPELSLYGTTKLCMEQLAAMFENVIVARLYNVYGKGSKSVVNKFTKSIKNDQAVVQYGNTTRDYVFIDDVVEALISIVKAEEPDYLYEIGTGREISLNKLISMIEKVTNKKANVLKKDALDEIQDSVCPITGLWKTINIEQGIRRLL